MTPERDVILRILYRALAVTVAATAIAHAQVP
jgi:hypothetical protein